MEKLALAVSATDHVAAPVAAGLTFALGVEQQIQRDIRLGQLIPESIQHFKAVMALKPAIWGGDQQVDVGSGPACPRALEPNRRTSLPGIAWWIRAAIAGRRCSIDGAFNAVMGPFCWVRSPLPGSPHFRNEIGCY
jgi:hypothetical protein